MSYTSYTSYTESTNYGCRLLIKLDFCCPSMCSMCPPCAETQAARRFCHCFMALSISCWSILSHLLLFLQKRHNYVTAHRIFNRLCQNQITVSQLTYSLTDIRWKFHKLCPKTVRNIWKKQMYHLFSEHGIDLSIYLSISILRVKSIYKAHALRYDTRCCFNVRSKAGKSQFNLQHGTRNEKVGEKKRKLKSKNGQKYR